MKPKVSAVVVNRNGAHHLRTCLPSLLAQTYSPIETVVVDNCSSDESESVAREFGAKWLPLARNAGLAPALNRGAEIASGELLLFVNNDMRFDKDFVAHLAECLEKDESVFAADGMQFNWDGTAQVHLATRVAKSRSTGICVGILPGMFVCQSKSQHAKEVFMASAASMLVRRTFFERLQGFDERLPLSYEDVEICWRAWLQGWKTVYVPDAICWHRVGASSKTPNEKLLLFTGVLRGRLLVATKLLPPRYALATWTLSLIGAGRDIVGLRGGALKARLKELRGCVSCVRPWLREKRQLYLAAGKTPQQQLEFFLMFEEREGTASGRQFLKV